MLKMRFGLLFIFAIWVEFIHSSDCKLYMKMEFPIKDNASTTSSETFNIMGRVQCASLCNVDNYTCKAFNYLTSNKICKLIDFQFSNPEIAISSDKMIGHVEHGTYNFYMWHYMICLTKNSHNTPNTYIHHHPTPPVESCADNPYIGLSMLSVFSSLDMKPTSKWK